MKLEQQVVSLELSKWLGELGVKPKDSLFIWTLQGDGDDFVNVVKRNTKANRLSALDKIPALTLAELGEFLPHVLVTKNGSFKLYTYPDIQYENKEKTKWSSYGFWCGYYRMNDYRDNYHESFDSDSEANARAKALIYLLENKLITL